MFTEEKQQILVGCQNGCLYVIQDVKEPVFYASVGYTISKILRVSVPGTLLSAVAACGHWNGLILIHKQQVSP